MRLWHKCMLPYLPSNRIMGQWRELKAIVGIIDIHGRVNHSTINPIMNFSTEHYATYYRLVYKECRYRGYDVDGSILERYTGIESVSFNELYKGWHEEEYFDECISNLETKWMLGKIKEKEWIYLQNCCQKIYDKWELRLVPNVYKEELLFGEKR